VQKNLDVNLFMYQSELALLPTYQVANSIARYMCVHCISYMPGIPSQTYCTSCDSDLLHQTRWEFL